MDKHTETYGSSPSEESNQEHTVEDVYHRHKLESDPDETDIAGENGSGEVSPEDEVNLTKLAKDSAKRSDLISSNETRRVSGDSTRLQSGINQPLGLALSENRFETVTKLGLAKHTSSEM